MNIKDVLLDEMAKLSLHRVRTLAGELARTDDTTDKELILAEMEFERWLADQCATCLDRR